MPDFVSFDQYQEANGSEERRQMEEAYARAEAADQKANQALNRSKTDAQRGRQAQANRQNEIYYANNRDRLYSGAKEDDPTWTGGEPQGIASTSSYSDYLQAQKDSANAWAALQTQSSNPYEQGLRDSLGGKDRATAAGTAGKNLISRGVDALSEDERQTSGIKESTLASQRGWQAGRQTIRDKNAAESQASADYLRSLGDPTTWVHDVGKEGGMTPEELQYRSAAWSRINAGNGNSATSPQAIAARRYASSGQFLGNAWRPTGPGGMGPKGPGFGFNFGGTSYDENGKQRGNIVSIQDAQGRSVDQQRQDEDQRIKNAGSTGYSGGYNPYK